MGRRIIENEEFTGKTLDYYEKGRRDGTRDTCLGFLLVTAGVVGFKKLMNAVERKVEEKKKENGPIDVSADEVKD